MPPIKLQHVVSCSSEDETYKAENLLKGEAYRKWKCASPGEKQLSVILQFEKASQIHTIDIGNESSAFVEILVGRSTSEDYGVILVSSSFMSPKESKSNLNANRVRMFGANSLSKTVACQKWDRVKIVCTQPFNKHISYGLSFVKFHSPPESEKPQETASASLQEVKRLGAFKLKAEPPAMALTAGSLFRDRDKIAERTEAKLTGVAAVRAASTAAAAVEHKKFPTSPHKTDTATHLPQRTQASANKHKLLSESTEHKPAKKFSPIKKEKERPKKEVQEKIAPTPPPQKKAKVYAPRKSEKAKDKPEVLAAAAPQFSELMSGVVFVLSGFQNPQRSQLRDRALQMGAKYRPDWDTQSTHLICAFPNTPKYQQVKGKGNIVKKEWITDCHKRKKLLPWKRYQLDDDQSSEDESSEESDSHTTTHRRPQPSSQTASSEVKPVKPTRQSPIRAVPSNSKEAEKEKTGKIQTTESVLDDEYGSLTEEENSEADKKSPKAFEMEDSDTEDEILRIQGNQGTKLGVDPYDVETDEEDCGQRKPLYDERGVPELPDFFTGKHFFLYGNFENQERRMLVRYITAFNGSLEEYMVDGVTHVITESTWDENFDKALSENSGLLFVRPKWIYDCADNGKSLPPQPYAIEHD